MKRKVLAVLFATALTAGMLAGLRKHGQQLLTEADQKEDSLEEETTRGTDRL